MKRAAWLMLAGCLMLPGCAGLELGDCRRVDWHGFGVRDGETNSNLIAHYARHCASAGAQADAAAYAKGRSRGLWVRQKDHLLYTP